MYRSASEAPAPPTPPLRVDIDGLVAAYGSSVVLRVPSLQLATGTVYGLVGPNGAGKSTLMRCVAGLHPPAAGRVLVDGVAIADAAPEARPRVALMPDRPPLFERLSAREYLRAAARMLGDDDQAVQRWLHRVGLLGRSAVDAASLSLGQRQRLGLARAMLGSPALVLLDEPANGMDPDARAMLADVMREAAARGATVIISSHVLSELDAVCDAFVMIHNGTITGIGTAHELAGASREHAFVHVLFAPGCDNAPERLAAAIEGLGDVAIERCGAEGARLRVDARPESRAKLLGAMVSAGLPVVEFTRERAQIAEVYAQHTSRLARR